MTDQFTMDQPGYEAAYQWLNQTHQFHLLDAIPKSDGYTVITLANTLWVQQNGGVEREFEIWMEGYQATGESGGAQLVGKSTGWTFYDAVKNLADRSHKGKFDWYGGRWSIWACRLFDNEADARKSFG
jgi:hypothetical protein